MVAEYYGWEYLDTGLLYRAAAYKMLQNNLEVSDVDKIVALAKTISQKDLNSEELRAEKIAQYSSQVAAIPEVRQALFEYQREFANNKNAILEGRDIGTVICPDAQIKLFFDANLEVRAKRRFAELQKRYITVSYENILADMKARDERDKNRLDAPLKAADDAIIIDNTNIPVDEVFAKILVIIKQKISP
jgi:CMP/dCMP kinase